MTCAISIAEDENASDVQDRVVASFKRALASQLDQQLDYPICCSFDAIDALDLPNACKGLFKGILMPFRFMPLVVTIKNDHSKSTSTGNAKNTKHLRFFPPAMWQRW